MKRQIVFFAALLWLGSAVAQGTFQFTANLTGAQEVPPNSSPHSATGNFTLDGSFLQWTVALDSSFFDDTGGFVHGPASPGSTAPVLFDLGTRFVFNPPGGNVVYFGNRTLNAAEINDLFAALWYVNITTEAYPGGEIRGQIVPVPEPSTWALLLVGGALCVCFKVKKRTG